MNSSLAPAAPCHLAGTRQKIVLDGERMEVHLADGATLELPVGSREAFRIISDYWLRSGWDTKYVYGFSYLGRPIIQLPEDSMRLQEVIYSVAPDVVIETGVAHGGGLVFYASLLRAMGRGRVIGIDIEIRPHNRQAIEAHELFDLITLIEGSSTDSGVVDRVHALVDPGESVLVILDANHTREHVRAELEAYADLVSVGSYLVACDGIMEGLAGAPRSEPDWAENNPRRAAEDFVRDHPRFEIVEPAFPFNEGEITDRVTYWPGAFVRRLDE